MADLIKGWMHCPICDKPLQVVVTVRSRPELCYVKYRGHSSKSGSGHKKCPDGRVDYASPLFPVWASRGVDNQFG